MKFNKLLSNALLKATTKTNTYKNICPKCGFMLPKYTGRYCANCPLCKTEMNLKSKDDSMKNIKDEKLES